MTQADLTYVQRYEVAIRLYLLHKQPKWSYLTGAPFAEALNALCEDMDVLFLDGSEPDGRLN